MLKHIIPIIPPLLAKYHCNSDCCVSCLNKDYITQGKNSVNIYLRVSMKINDSNIEEFRQRLAPKIMPGSISVQKNVCLLPNVQKLLALASAKNRHASLKHSAPRKIGVSPKKKEGILLRENRVLLARNKITGLTVCLKKNCIEKQAKDRQHKKWKLWNVAVRSFERWRRNCFWKEIGNK